MKNKITLLAVIVVLTAVIYSCRKELDIADSPQISEVIINITVAEAELSFNNNKSKNSGDAIFSANKKHFLGKPFWKNSEYLKIKNTSKVLRTPVYSFSKSNPFRRDLLSVKKANGKVKEVVMDFRPNKNYLKKMANRGGTVRRDFMDNKDFSGNILLSDVNGRLISGLIFSKGKLVYEVRPKTGSSSNGKKFSSMRVSDIEGNMTDGFILDEVIVTAVMDDPDALPPFLFQELDLPVPPEFEDISPDEFYELMEYMFSFWVYPPPVVSDVRNDVGNACVSATVDRVMNSGLENRLASILGSVFGNNPHVTVIFEDAVTLPSDLNGKFVTCVNDGYGGSKIYIALNAAVLGNASQEFTAVTVLHEAIHGYLAFVNETAKLDHTDMSLNYRGAIEDYLINCFGTDPAEASKLAWQGLITNPYEVHPLWDTFKNTYPTAAAGIESTLSSHRAPGTSGTRCPPPTP